MFAVGAGNEGQEVTVRFDESEGMEIAVGTSGVQVLLYDLRPSNPILTKDHIMWRRPSTIIFGMDVSHGSPGDANVSSIAAVVATKNWPDVFNYTTQVRTQPAKMEMIEGLYEAGGGMVKECLRAHHSTCRNLSMRKPSQINIYRSQ